MKNKQTIHPTTGLSTILLIFVILAMTLLSLLTYMRVMQDHQTLNREYMQKQEYYKAESLANYIYQEYLDGALIIDLEKETSIDINEYEQYIQFEIPILEKQVLSVSFDINGDILKWQVKRGE